MLRPLGDWVLVRTEELPQQIGLIHVPQGTNVYTAEVLAVGPGRWTSKGARRPVDVQVGERITFYRWNLEHKPGQALKGVLQELGDNIALIQERDILFAIPAGEKVVVL